MKLHLGCGQKYLDGYLNIDFPADSHSVQQTSPADLHADLLALHYPAGSVDEVRLHHVFEHFTRPVACALLCTWHTWLKEGGLLRLEVPDFRRTAAVILNPLASPRAKGVAMRHLFGSHEAHWAVHCEGYTPGILEALLQTYGFQVTERRRNAWQGTHNIEFLARKTGGTLDPAEAKRRTGEHLARYLLDPDLEDALLETWMTMFDHQLQQGLRGDE